MSGFNFRLQTLLDLKLRLEDNLKNELGKAIKNLEEQKELLCRQENKLDEQISHAREEASKGITVAKLREYNMYMSFLKQQIQMSEENVKNARKTADKYRERLARALQERRALEKLKERKYEEFLKEQLKHEQVLNDEITSYKFIGEQDAESAR